MGVIKSRPAVNGMHSVTDSQFYADSSASSTRRLCRPGSDLLPRPHHLTGRLVSDPYFPSGDWRAGSVFSLWRLRPLRVPPARGAIAVLVRAYRLHRPQQALRCVVHERGATEPLLYQARTGEPSLTASPLADGFSGTAVYGTVRTVVWGTAGVTPPPTRFLRPAWALARRCGMRGACQVLYRPGRGNGELKAAQRGWLLNERVEVPPAHIPVWRRSHVRQPTGATLTVESPDVNVLREGVSPTDQPRRLTTRGAVARANGRIVEISPQHEVGYWNVELRWSRKTGQVVKV